MTLLCFVDVHSHLYDSKFGENISAVIDRAFEAGVKKAIVVSESFADCAKILKLTEQFPDFIFPGFGVHPVQGDGNFARSACQQDVDLIRPFIEEHHSKLICIGEVGLDFTPRYCTTEEAKESQRAVLLQMVEIASQYNLPLNVHSRSAGRPTITLLKSVGARNVVLHAFDGKPSVALEGVASGFYFSIPPSIIRSEQKTRLVKAVPLDHLLLETDSPALGPEKMEINEPKNIVISCQQIATLKGIAMETVAQVTWSNTRKLFPRLGLAEELS